MTLASIGYTLVETPVDFTRFMVRGFSADALKKAAGIYDKASLISTTLSVAEAFGYASPALRAINEQLKSFKMVCSIITLPSNFYEIGGSNTNKGIGEISGNVGKTLTGCESACKMLQQAGVQAQWVTSGLTKVVAAGYIAEVIEAGTGLVKGVNDLGSAYGEAGSVFEPSADIKLSAKGLGLVKAFWETMQKAMLIAFATLGIMSTTIAAFVAVPAVPAVVIPSLLFAATMFDLFAKYADSKKAPQPATAIGSNGASAGGVGGAFCLPPASLDRRVVSAAVMATAGTSDGAMATAGASDGATATTETSDDEASDSDREDKSEVTPEMQQLRQNAMAAGRSAIDRVASQHTGRAVAVAVAPGEGGRVSSTKSPKNLGRGGTIGEGEGDEANDTFDSPLSST